MQKKDSEPSITAVWVQKLLPAPELRTALVVGDRIWLPRVSLTEIESTGDDRQSLINDLNTRLSTTNAVYTSILLPNNFTNLQTALKTLINGLIRHHDHRTQPLFDSWAYLIGIEKRRATVSVAAYDMQLLCSWFNWASSRENEGMNISQLFSTSENYPVPRLVVLIPDLESCTATVVHDLLHICR